MVFAEGAGGRLLARWRFFRELIDDLFRGVCHDLGVRALAGGDDEAGEGRLGGRGAGSGIQEELLSKLVTRPRPDEVQPQRVDQLLPNLCRTALASHATIRAVFDAG